MKEGIDKTTIKRGLKLSLAVSIIASIILFIITINEGTLEQIMSVNTYYLGLAIVISFLMWIVGGLRIKLIADALEENISVRTAFNIFLAGAFVSNVTPFASGGGPAQVLLLHREGMSLGKSSTVIIVQFILRLLFFGIVSPVLFIIFKDLINPGFIPENLFNILILIALLISVVIIYFIWQPNKIKIITDRIKDWRLLKPLMKKKKTKKLLEEFYQEMEEFHNSLWQLTKYKKSSLVGASIATVVYWALFFVIAPVILLGLGAEPFFLRSFIMQTIFYLILPYIPTPGASGLAEFGFASLFSSFVPSGLIGLLAIVWRFLTFYLVLILGGLILLKMLAKSVVTS